MGKYVKPFAKKVLYSPKFIQVNDYLRFILIVLRRSINWKKNAVQYIKSLCLSAVAFAATSAALAAEKLYVYNWTDYVPSNLVAEFTKETGIEVIYSTFESNEEMYAKLKLTSSTGSGYDLVFPSSYYVNKNGERRHVTRAWSQQIK